MFKENKLINITFNFKTTDDIGTKMSDKLSMFDKIHSCIVYGKYENEQLVGWKINCNISQTDFYNTVRVNELITRLLPKLELSKQFTEPKYVVAFAQPSLDVLIKQYKPLIIKLANEQHERWNWLEMEDLIQMCNLVICDLYYKGYYVHKRLIYRSFVNYVLMHIRKDKGKTYISLEQTYSKSDSDTQVTMADMLPDESTLYEQDDKDDEEVQCKILQEVKGIVIDFIGPRQYDQLLREYSNKQTTNWSRKLMQTIKAHLFEMGISKKSFDRYYN